MRLGVLIMAAGLWLTAAMAGAQQNAATGAGRARLALSVEVATTTEEGYPSSVRITLTNVGPNDITLPLLSVACMPDNGYDLEIVSRTRDGHSATIGGGCGGQGGDVKLKDRIKQTWIVLRPGEFMTDTANLKTQYEGFPPSTITWSIKYIPPTITKKALAELSAEGILIPTENLETERQTFEIQ